MLSDDFRGAPGQGNISNSFRCGICSGGIRERGRDPSGLRSRALHLAKDTEASWHRDNSGKMARDRKKRRLSDVL
jgi:hypothetical protein